MANAKARFSITLFSAERESEARHWVDEFGGTVIGSGTMLAGPHAGERDLEFEVISGRAVEAMSQLGKFGFVRKLDG